MGLRNYTNGGLVYVVSLAMVAVIALTSNDAISQQNKPTNPSPYCPMLYNNYKEKLNYWGGRLKKLKESDPDEIFIQNIKRAFQVLVSPIISEARREGCDTTQMTDTLEKAIENQK